MSNKSKLNRHELRYILRTMRANSSPDRSLSKDNKNELYDKLAKTYINQLNPETDLVGIKFKTSSFRTIQNGSVLEFIIHVLAVLTGYPESSIGLSTNLEDIGVTPMKKEITRRRINRYLKDNGYDTFITVSETGKCETVKDLYDLTISKM